MRFTRLPFFRSVPYRKSAFTLIELLIVVAIIAILAAIAVPNFLEAQVRAKVSRVRADQRTLATAMESYAVDNNRPLPTFNGTFTAPWAGSSATETRQDRFHWLTSPISYITSPIRDPFVEASTVSNPINSLMIIWSDPVWLSGTLPGASAGTNCAPNMFQEQIWRNMTQDPKAFWTVLSAGPDRDYDVLAGNDPEYSIRGIQDYDPTNGTVSDGDLVRSRGQ